MGNRPSLIIHDIDKDTVNEVNSLNSLADFFASPKFSPVDLSVPNKYGQLTNNDGKSIINEKMFCIDTNLLWVSDYGGGKPALPVYKLEHNFYWKGMFLMPIYHHTSIDHPLLLQLHWNRGDNIVNISHNEWSNPTFQAIVFKINEIMVQQGAVWAIPIQLFRPDQQNHVVIRHRL